jgi:hypothetical protein
MFFFKQKIKIIQYFDFVDAINRDLRDKLKNIGLEVINVKVDVNSDILNLKVCLNSEEILPSDTITDK